MDATSLNFDTIAAQISFYGLKILAAAVIFIVGRWLARLAVRIMKTVMERGKVEDTLVSFVSSIAYALLLVFVVIAALSQLGVQTTSIVAVIGAAGLAVGLALQGSLSNFAAGVMIIALRPFKLGDRVKAAGQEGLVHEISVFSTVLKTADNTLVIIPNAKITSDIIINAGSA